MYRMILCAAVLLPLAGNGTLHSEEVNVGGTGAALGLLYRLGDEFTNGYPGDRLKIVPGMGSGGGIAAVMEGALHVAISSRDLKPQESAKGLESARLFETPFVFVTSHPQPPGFKKSDVVAIYDGALVSWPDGKPIKLILRPKSDSVSDFMIASFDGMQSTMEKLRQRPDVPVAATDQDNIEAAERIENSFSGATLSQLITERSRVQRISVDGVHASVAAMEDGTYPLKIRMFVVTKPERSPAAQRFITFLRSAQAEKVFRDNGAARIGQ